MAEEGELSKRIDDLHRRFDDLRADFTRRFEEIKHRFDEITSRLDGQATRLDTLTAHLDTRLDALAAGQQSALRWTITTMVALFGIAVPVWMWVLSLVLKPLLR